MKLRTFVGYGKKGEKVKAYMLERYNFEELKNYMTLAEFEKIEYIQELKYDEKTTRKEDGSWNDLSEWKWDTKLRKHYIHK